MAHRIGDRILETTIVTGTGNATFLGAQVGYKSVDSFCTTNGDTIDLVIGWATNAGVLEFEYNRFTRVSAGVYSRAATPWSSSNAGAATSFTAGTKEVWSDIGAFFAEHLNTVPITVTSAATMDIGTVQGIRIDSSGTTGPVTSLGTSKNKLRWVKWSGQQITAGANLVLLGVPSGYTRTTASGDMSILSSDNQATPVWTEIMFQRASAPAAPFDALAYNGMQLNGSMEVSQEKGATAIVGVADGTYLLDGFDVVKAGTMVFNSQQVTDAPSGYANSLKISVTTAEASLGATDVLLLRTNIEGYRTQRLAFGSASAQPLSFGFWVKAHRTGAYSGTIANSAINRTYPFSFTVNAADTWEFKTVSLLGDTGGTWLTGTSIGLRVYFAIAVGSTYVGATGAWIAGTNYGVSGSTNGVAATTDTFQITGLIVLPGIELPSSTRAPLIMRPFPQELLLCQRYYEVENFDGSGPNPVVALGQAISTSATYGSYVYSEKRIAPTITAAGTFKAWTAGAAPSAGTIGFDAIAVRRARISMTAVTGSPLAAGNAAHIVSTTASDSITVNARL